MSFLAKKLPFDLETVPAPAARRNAILNEHLERADEEVQAIKPPGNLKKAETIAEWMATEAPLKRQAIIDEAMASAETEWRKTALSAAHGRIYTIGYSVNGEEAVAPTLEDFGASLDDIINGTPKAQDAERAMMAAWFKHCAYTKANQPFPQYIGHNISGFDLRFVFQRAVILGVELPVGFPITAKPWESDRIFDTMLAWAGNGKTVKLDVVCEALGLQLKGEELDGEHIDGSMVVDYVYRGEGRKVATYCIGDVNRSWQIYGRLQPALAVL